MRPHASRNWYTRSMELTSPTSSRLHSVKVSLRDASSRNLSIMKLRYCLYTAAVLLKERPLKNSGRWVRSMSCTPSHSNQAAYAGTRYSSTAPTRGATPPYAPGTPLAAAAAAAAAAARAPRPANASGSITVSWPWLRFSTRLVPSAGTAVAATAAAFESGGYCATVAPDPRPAKVTCSPSSRTRLASPFAPLAPSIWRFSPTPVCGASTATPSEAAGSASVSMSSTLGTPAAPGGVASPRAPSK
mmetsp:Transcript_10558/g.43650  ORF Transcript_10558/g.43650 Transcript_10558/m.43650 type:complete len:245 (+) Transcript_10558:77-811(+)